MKSIEELYRRIVGFLEGKLFESLALLLTRIALAGVFWRSYKTKIVEGTWFEPSAFQRQLFMDDFGFSESTVDLVVPLTIYAEFFFPILVAFGLFTRFAASALLVMTLFIQFFIFPDAWWASHSLWAAMAAILISRGGGILSLDALLVKMRG